MLVIKVLTMAVLLLQFCLEEMTVYLQLFNAVTVGEGLTYSHLS